MYKLLLKPILFLFPPEVAHHVALSLFKVFLFMPGAKALALRLFTHRSGSLAVDAAGLHFTNPVGLAAGFDKDAKYLHLMKYLGFGFVEVGAVTPRPQKGNPRPRLFRLKKDRALINRMGFNNLGVRFMLERLKQRPPGLVVGVNLGKNKDTPTDMAYRDYCESLSILYAHADFFTVNVSSPNTPGLRELQEDKHLAVLIAEIEREMKKQDSMKPVFLKISPDLEESQVRTVVDLVNTSSFAGIIATNTSIGREGLQTPASRLKKIGAGGLSGSPVRTASTNLIAFIRKHLRGDKVIIGVGGISSGADASEKIQQGATLLQVYTGLIYEGPALIRNILRHLESDILRKN